MDESRGSRARIAATAGGGVALCALLATTACGGGGTTATQTVTAAPVTSSAHAPGATDPGATDAGATTAASAPVGEVPGSPGAAKALRPWLADVTAKDLAALTAKCWTQPPGVIGAMYGDAAKIAEAVAKPGVLGQFGPQWRSAATTVHLRPSEVASAYGCPDVYPTGGAMPVEKARYAVVRYLSRHVGKPVNAADVEADYPLLCQVRSGTPDLSEVTGFAADQVEEPRVVTTSAGRVTSVTSRVDTRSGIRKAVNFTLDTGPDGYCIRNLTLR
ncbi:hypothetical protein [Tsukamurella paurometabola]|uniref:Lipoprotein n=1 Tax=Tsukamurella paurometabola TaxID=2061 RepID=A0ABS5NGE4_TSUPA|nr:hypothetical protein [Tsukamurella paurometabola]MBS4103366.1 hypothetical protein [Tsukamurella paurometabola]